MTPNSEKPFRVRAKQFMLQVCMIRLKLISSGYSKTQYDLYGVCTDIKNSLQFIFSDRLLAKFLLENQTNFRNIITGSKNRNYFQSQLDSLIAEAKVFLSPNEIFVLNIKNSQNENNCFNNAY